MIQWVYLLIILVLGFWGATVEKKGCWNEESMSLNQMKILQGFCAICIMFHHIGQKTCAPWLNPGVIVHGFDYFVQIGYYFVAIFMVCSGYGLYKSVKSKPNYLNGFIRHRIMPIIIANYVTGWIFLIVRFLVGQKMDTPQIVYYITGLQLSNPNGWYVIAMPIFYFIFYLAFRIFKKENAALFGVFAGLFVYTLIGTIVDHNNWWMRGEWWYNTTFFFLFGMLVAKYEKGLRDHLKKHYLVYLILSFVLIFVLYYVSQYTLDTVSYYGELFFAKDKVWRRWICLFSQIAASGAFVFFIFLLRMKVRMGNKLLVFMGTITLEFYLIHGVFIELFGYSFADACPSVYYIKNVAVFLIVVATGGVISAVLLKKLLSWIDGIVLYHGKKAK